MPSTFHVKNISDYNLHEEPKALPLPPEITHISFGDIHGNALKLINQLILTGFISLSKNNDYSTLVKLYNQEKLDGDDIKLFNTILYQASIDNSRSLTLIGDELCDRGANDYLTLLVIKRISLTPVDLDIMLSNHSMGMIEYMETGANSSLAHYPPEMINSMLSMVDLIGEKTIQMDEVKDLYNKSYIPLIKAVSYTYCKISKELSIYTHAPSGLNNIIHLAKSLDIKYSHKTPQELMKTIDGINGKIYNHLRDLSLSKFNYDLTKRYDRSLDVSNSPIVAITNNRHDILENYCLPIKAGIEYSIQFVHGHVGQYDIESRYHTNLDNDLGKASIYLDILSGNKGIEKNIINDCKFGFSSQLTCRQMLEIKRHTSTNTNVSGNGFFSNTHIIEIKNESGKSLECFK